MAITKLHQYKSDYFDKYDWLDLIIVSLVFLFYTTILWNESVAKPCYQLLALIALYLIVTRKITYKLCKLEKLFLWSIAAYFIWLVISYFVNHMPERGGRWIMNTQLRILLIIPVYLLLRSRPIPVSAWWLIISCGAIIAGLLSITQVSWATGWPTGMRAYGDNGAIIFGGISLCMAFIALTGINYYTRKRIAILFIIPVCLGLLAMILSGSRGVWVSLPFIILTVFWSFARKYSIQKKIFVMLMLLIIPVVLLQFPATQKRVTIANTQFQDYFQSENNPGAGTNTSVGLRLEIWRIMLQTVKENPWFGVGIGGFKAERQRYFENNEITDTVNRLPHSHNQYLDIAVYSGILGLALHLCLYIIPGIAFFRGIKNQSDSNLPFYTSGAIMIIAYSIFGLTDITLNIKAHIMFYFLTSSILLSFVYQKQIPEYTQ